jgi:hypothetical protein
MLGVGFRIVDTPGNGLPWDGTSVGDLRAMSPDGSLFM